jgi:hypothetical protein
MIDRDDITDLRSAAAAVQDALVELVERLEVLLPESEPEPVPDAERFMAEVPAEPTRRLPVDVPESFHARIKLGAHDKAQRVASVILDAIHDNVATKVDVQASEAALRSEIAAVRADLSLVERRLFTRLGGLIVVVTGIILAVLRFLPPPHG